MRVFQFIVMLLWIVAGLATCPAQVVSVRLVDCQTGQSLPGRPLSLVYSSTGEIFHSQWQPTQYTGADGVATHHLPQPLPPRIAVVQYPTSPPLCPCSGYIFVDTQQVIAEGVVLLCPKPPEPCYCKKCKKRSNQITKTPGELVVFARPFTLWENVLRHVWE